jgi:signal transduction histidine kinase
MSKEVEQALQQIWPLPYDPATVLTARVIADARAMEIADTEAADLPAAARATARAAGYRSIIWVPLVREGQGIGSLVLTHPEAGQKLEEKQLALFKTFADQAVIAIENVRLFNETKESLERQTATSEILKVISTSTTDTQPVFDAILASCERLFQGMDTSIQLAGDDGQVHLAGYRGPNGAALRRHFPVPLSMESASGTAILLARPGHYPDLDAPDVPEYARRAAKLTGYKASLFAPMIREGKGVGAISVLRREARPFSEKEIAMLMTFAAQAVIAIENVRLFKEIQEKSKQLEEASEHKSQFLASMSHELRTPLNAILGFNEMMLDGLCGDLPKDFKEPLEETQKSGKHLLRLINNVLDLAKIEAGRMELALGDYSVQDTVEGVRSTLRPLAEAKGLQLLVTVPPDLPLAHGDPGRLSQCLMNLAGNSLKFTKQGKVEISVNQENGQLRYSVADTGIGIAPEKIGSLFTEFKQTDATIANEYGGTGLGLSITKKFIEMHGGRIWVESEVGKGSAFIFEIPLRVAQ